VGNAQARRSNPDCVVDYKVVETAHIPKSFVELQFSDNESHKLYTADLKVADIVKIIEQKATEMELRSVMKDVTFDPFARAAASGKADKSAA
jgi:large subunit ribosomal protein L53